METRTEANVRRGRVQKKRKRISGIVIFNYLFFIGIPIFGLTVWYFSHDMYEDKYIYKAQFQLAEVTPEDDDFDIPEPTSIESEEMDGLVPLLNDMLEYQSGTSGINRAYQVVYHFDYKGKKYAVMGIYVETDTIEDMFFTEDGVSIE